MKAFKFILLTLLILLINNSGICQNNSQYTLESLIEILGRTQWSSKVVDLNNNLPFKKSTVQNRDKQTEHLWYNDQLNLWFTTDDVFGDDLRTVGTIGFQLEEVKLGDYPMLEQGFLGIKGYMKRSKAEKILAEIDPNFTNENSKAWANYKDDYKIKVQFTGEKGSSQVLRIYVYLNEDKSAAYLKEDFLEFGPEVLLPPNVANRYYQMKDDLHYINVIPEKGCETCYKSDNSTGTIEFPNSSRYEGDFSNLLGTDGTYTFEPNEKYLSYSGSFLNGEASGKGRLSPVNGETIHGIWVNGIINTVEFMQKDGFAYTGEVSPDLLMNGKGVIISIAPSTFRCEGVFTNDQVLTHIDYIIKDDGNKYIGRINQAFQPDGKGQLLMTNGDTYFGSFVNGDFHGGTVNVTYEGGNRYEGELNYDNQMHGQGTISFADGGFVKGRFENGIYLGGTGSLKLDNGAVYEGEINGQKEAAGQGTYTYLNGDYVKCITTNGVFSNAEGKKTLLGGSVYTGQFNDRLVPDGLGKVKGDDGTYLAGEFSNDSYLGGTGFLKYDNGTAYEGEIDGDKNPMGEGIYFYVFKSDYIRAEFGKTGVIPGYGERHFADGSEFKGHVDREGNPDGQGTATWSNGVAITGNFKGGRPTGTVTMTDGSGTWEGPVDDQYRPHGTGRYRSSSYSSWQSGTFSHGQPQ